MVSRDAIRDDQREKWGALSASWEKWDAVLMDQLGPVRDAIVEQLAIRPDQQHLDVACGSGEPGLTIATLAPNGRIVLTDLAPEMLDVARRRAHARGISNFEAVACSADDLPFPDASFDSISVRFGYMFFPDLALATRELARVLKPGGRLCASVWVKPEENPWTNIVMRAVATEVRLPTADPDAPGMYRCAAPGYMGDLFRTAGLQDVVEWEVPVALVTRSPLEYWEIISEHVSLATAALQQVDASARARIADIAIAEARAYEHDGSTRVPGLARCIAGTKQ